RPSQDLAALARGVLGELGAGLDGGVERRGGVFRRGVGHLAQGVARRWVLNAQRSLAAVDPLPADVQLLGDLIEYLLLLSGADRRHEKNLPKHRARQIEATPARKPASPSINA